ncbi:hypothetical protein HNY73_000832 [Argiope bruennichi]|uniref:Uncharacterized protein n=1 Tax=Argiope bruennichi TaxID=94029 RepID=A0A8T0FZJ4_ARGBR|nr:hypothetical protein HNY73_000832 [Argiope bruennichi]
MTICGTVSADCWRIQTLHLALTTRRIKDEKMHVLTPPPHQILQGYCTSLIVMAPKAARLAAELQKMTCSDGAVLKKIIFVDEELSLEFLKHVWKFRDTI